MNVIWAIVMVFGFVLLITNKNTNAFECVLSGGNKAIALGLKLWAIYAVWLGILNIVKMCELDKKITKFLRPIIRKLIGKYDDYTENQIALNISSSMLGMGNASTPSGINALQGMSAGVYITSGMAMLLILNTSSLQIIPSTIMSLRAMHGSSSASDIILPCIISSLASAFIGIVLIKICSKIFKDEQ